MTKLIDRLDRLDERTGAHRLRRGLISRDTQRKVWWIHLVIGVAAIVWGVLEYPKGEPSTGGFAICVGIASIFAAGFLLKERLTEGDRQRSAKLARWGPTLVMLLVGASAFIVTFAYGRPPIVFAVTAGAMGIVVGWGISEVLFPRDTQNRP